MPPRYVVLVGEGSLDYRNLQGYGDCVMPPLMIQGEGGFFPSDNRFADMTGDGLPDMALGRIPVLTAAELSAWVDKILAYEAPASRPGPATRSCSPTTRTAADFAADSDRIAGLLPPGLPSTGSTSVPRPSPPPARGCSRGSKRRLVGQLRGPRRPRPAVGRRAADERGRAGADERRAGCP